MSSRPTNGSRGRVVLYSPRLADPRTGYTASRDLLPLSVLAVAGISAREGYEVVVIDGNLYPVEEAHRRVVEACEGALCYGTTGILGYQITDGLHATRRVRAAHPRLPTVVGGWFASVMPEMYLATGVYDAVCLGQGELTFAELVRACDSGEPFDGVAGLALLREGEVVRTDARRVVGWDELPNLPWHLIDIAPYRDGQLAGRPARELERSVVPPGFGRKPFFCIPYFSSFGCPEPCGFCCSPEVTSRRWKAMPAERMLDDLCELHERWGFDSLRFFDANPGVSEKRMGELTRGLVERGRRIWWYALMQTEHIARYADATLDVMRDSGMYCLQLGAETGDDGVLNTIGKPCAPEVNERAVQRLSERGVCSLATYIIGFPDESEASMMRTIDQCQRLGAISPLCRAMAWPYNPLPGTSLYARSLELGFRAPETLEGWGTAHDFHLVGRSSWPGQIPPAVARRRRVYEHFASLSIGVGLDRMGLWSRRAQQRVRRQDYRFGMLEARVYTLVDRLQRRLLRRGSEERAAGLRGYQTSVLAERARAGELPE